jgi:hypothetical protein
VEKTFRTFPVHKLVSLKYPIEGNSIDLAFGSAFDHAISQFTYYASYASYDKSLKMKAFRHFLYEFNHNTQLSYEQRKPYMIKAWRMLNAFITTPIFQERLLRDRTRAVIINDVAMFAQPDFVNRLSQTIYEVKTYELKDKELLHATYQTKLFQLAYPKFKAVIVGFIYDGQRANPQYVTLEPLTLQETQTLLNDIIEYANHGEIEVQKLGDVVFDRVSIHYDKDGKYHEEDRKTYYGRFYYNDFFDEEDYWEEDYWDEDYDSYVAESEHEKPKQDTKQNVTQTSQAEHRKLKTLDRMLKKYGAYIEALKKENTS